MVVETDCSPVAGIQAQKQGISGRIDIGDNGTIRGRTASDQEEIPGNDGEVLSATESREAVPPVQPKKVKMLSEDELTGLLAQITMESQREI